MIYQLQEYIELIDPNYQALQSANLEQIVFILQQAQIQNPKLALNNFAQLIQILSNCASGVIQQVDPNITLRILKVANSVIGSFKSKFRNGNKYDEHLKKIVEVNLKLIASISDQISQEWIKPPQGINVNTDSPQDQNLSNDALSAFDILIEFVGIDKLSKFLNAVSEEIIQLDWRNKYAFLMGFSQLGQYVQQPSYISDYVNYTVKTLKNNNPKIRYASLHAIGQLSDDMRPGFQQHFTDLLLPMIFEAVSDPVPRVASHALACLTNFIENFYDLEKLRSFVPVIFKKLLQLMEDPNTVSLINESNVSTLSSICTVQDLLDQNSIEIAINIIKKAYERYHQGQIYIQMRGQILEAISFVVGAQNHKFTQKYLTFTIQLLQQITTNGTAAYDYILDAWSRIFNYFEDLPLEISPIVDGFLAFTQIQENSSQTIKKAILAFTHMLTSYKQKFRQQIQKIIAFFANMSQQKLAQPQIKIDLINFYKQVVTSLKNQAPDPAWQKIIRDLYNYDLEEVKKILQLEEIQRSYIVLQALLNLMIVLIQNFGIVYTSQELVTHSQQIFSIFPSIEQAYRQQKQNFNLGQAQVSGDEIDQEVQLRQNLTKQLNDARLIVPDMVQVLLRVIPQDSKKVIIKQILIEVAKILSSTESLPKDIQYGIYFIDNLIEDYSFEQLKQYWPKFNQVLSKYSVDKHATVRNSSVFGLGILISKSPSQLILEIDVKNWIKIIKDSMSIPKDKQSEKNYTFCMDNSVAALGRLLKAFRYKLDLTQQFSQWLQMLPLNADKEEGNIQQQFLMQLIQQDPGLIIKGKEQLLYVLKAHAGFLRKRNKKTANEYKNRIKMNIFVMQKWPLFIENSNYLWSCLTNQQKQILMKITQG